MSADKRVWMKRPLQLVTSIEKSTKEKTPFVARLFHCGRLACWSSNKTMSFAVADVRGLWWRECKARRAIAEKERAEKESCAREPTTT